MTVITHSYLEQVLTLNESRVELHRTNKPKREEFYRKGLFPILLKCSDGRTSAVATTLGIPDGCGRILQTPGVLFSTENAYFSLVLRDAVNRGLARKLKVVIFVVAHRSEKHADHCCRAHGNNNTRAREHVIELARSIHRNFEPYNEAIYVIPIMINTDDDAIEWIGDCGQSVTSTSYLDTDCSMVHDDIEGCFSAKRYGTIYTHMTRLLLTNVAHVRELHAHPRDEHACLHQERCVAFGEGFHTWLNSQRNLAFILSPGSEHPERWIHTGCDIVQQNMYGWGVSQQKEGLLLLICAAFLDKRDQCWAQDRLRGYIHFVKKAMLDRTQDFPFTIVPATLHFETMQFDIQHMS